VATQDPVLRQKFTGSADHVVNYMRLIAQETREWMSRLGFRTIDEMVGRMDKLDIKKAVDHWKAQKLDLTPILQMPKVSASVGTRKTQEQDHGLSKALDNRLIEMAKAALDSAKPVDIPLDIRNANRTVGTMLGSEVTRRFGANGLPDDTIRIRFKGSAGQSFGAFLPNGITMRLEGDTNDYCGKGLSGGRLVIFPPADAGFTPEENIIVGNVSLYGATGGEAFIRGVGGERFAVRNSGATAVVEGVGDHGCEYMTRGVVVVLGRTGRNFAAGMSGGIAYVLDEDGDFPKRCNLEMVDLESFADSKEEAAVRGLIEKHSTQTGSARAAKIVKDWKLYRDRFRKVMPREYRRVLEAGTAAGTAAH
jgi:glutamate synthase (ferredoxin)